MEDAVIRLQDLKLGDKSSLSIKLQEPEYVLNIDSQLNSVADILLAATSSTSAIRLYNRSRLSCISTINAPEKLITGIRFSKDMPDVLYCSFSTGVLRAWDVRKSAETCVQELHPGLTNNLTLTAVDLSCDGRLVAAGTELTDDNAYIIFWDRRSPQVLGCYSESHSNDITQLRFHPHQKDSLLSCSTDGLVCVYDVSETTEDDALHWVFNADTSVAQTGWVGPDVDIVYCVTHMNTFMSWNAITGDEVLDTRSLSDIIFNDQHFDYVIDCFQPTKTSAPHLCVGNYSGAIGIYSIYDDKLNNITTLSKGHTSVVRCMSWNDQSNSLVTGGEDDMLCLWVSNRSQYTHTTPLRASSGKITSSKNLKRHRKSALV